MAFELAAGLSGPLKADPSPTNGKTSTGWFGPAPPVGPNSGPRGRTGSSPAPLLRTADGRAMPPADTNPVFRESCLPAGGNG